MLRQCDSDAFAAFDITGGGLDGSFHDRVADSLGNNLQHLQNGHAGADQRSQSAREADKADLLRKGADNRKFNPVRIPKITTALGFDIIKPAVDQSAKSDQEKHEVVPH